MAYRSCGECTYWRNDEGHPVNALLRLGQCRRYPPRPLPDQQLVGWPITQRSDGCGEGEAAADMDNATDELARAAGLSDDELAAMGEPVNADLAAIIARHRAGHITTNAAAE